MKIAAALVACNVPFSFADTLSSLFKDIFPDSEIHVASGYASRKTKTTCIINGALRDHFHSRLIEVIKTRPYSLAVDGSNDTELQKMNPLTWMEWLWYNC